MLATSSAESLHKKSIFNSAIFWIFFASCSVIAGIASYYYFPRTFEFLDISVTASRHDVIAQAAKISQENKIGPNGYSATAYFTSNSHLQHYVELQAGGKKAWQEVIKEGLFYPYTWRVRHFKEGEIQEATFIFTPEGTPYGYIEHISEAQPGPELSSAKAREIAEKTITAWGIDLTHYFVAEASEQKQPSGRIDHMFDYELSDRTLGEAYYRFCIKISGDKVTQLYHYIQVPEKFNRMYAQMRSINNTIYTAANACVALFYGLLGCIISLIALWIKRQVSILPAVLCAIIMASGQAALVLNDSPMYWANYNTAHSATGFMLNILFSACSTLLVWFTIYTLSFAAAESLTRRAFPNKLQFWKLFTAPLASTRQIWGQVWGAYLVIPFDLLFVLVFYTIGSKYFGFWSPSDSLIDPNIMSSYVPAFGSLMKSLSAGFWEECLFRAVPIAGCAILGEKIGNKKVGIILGFILQILIFGAAHANYPGQPSFVRIIELIIPSCMFGILYLRFGLLPGIISHTLYDTILFSLPIFACNAHGSFIQKFIVILCMFIPLLIIFFARMKTGILSYANSDYSYASLDTSIIEVPEKHIISAQFVKNLDFSYNTKLTIIITSIVSALVGIYLISVQPDMPPLHITKQEAIIQTQKTVQDLMIKLPDYIKILPKPYTSLSQFDNITEKFILQTAGKDTYKQLLGSYIQVPHWIVRYASFEGNIEQRAEEYTISVDAVGNVIQVAHILPESTPGKLLEEQNARDLTLTYIQNYYNLNKNQIKEVSASSTKHPNRKDWLFIFQDLRYNLPQGETRIAVVISGGEVSNSYPFIFIPEQWTRKHQEQAQTASIIHQIQLALFACLFLLGIWYQRTNILLLLHKKKVLIIFSTLYLVLIVSSIILDLPSIMANAKTAQSLVGQLLIFLMNCSISVIGMVFLITVVIGYIYASPKTSYYLSHFYALLATLSAGIFYFGITKCILFSLHGNTISWPNMTSANSFIPIIGVIVSYCLQYIIQTTKMGALTLLWPRKGLLISLLVGIALGFALTSFTFSASPVIWILCALIQGIAMAVLMEGLLIHDISLVPYITAVPLLLQLGSMVIYPGYPGAHVSALIAIVVLIIASHGWSKSLKTSIIKSFY